MTAIRVRGIANGVVSAAPKSAHSISGIEQLAKPSSVRSTVAERGFVAEDGSPVTVHLDANGRLTTAEATGKDGIYRRIDLASGLVDVRPHTSNADRFVLLRTRYQENSVLLLSMSVSVSMSSKTVITTANRIDGAALVYKVDFAGASTSSPAKLTRTVSIDGGPGFTQYGLFNTQTNSGDLPLDFEPVFPDMTSRFAFFAPVFNAFLEQYAKKREDDLQLAGLSLGDAQIVLYDLTLNDNSRKQLAKIIWHAVSWALMTTIAVAVGGLAAITLGVAAAAAVPIAAMVAAITFVYTALAVLLSDFGDVAIDQVFSSPTSSAAGGSSSSGNPAGAQGSGGDQHQVVQPKQPKDKKK